MRSRRLAHSTSATSVVPLVLAWPDAVQLLNTAASAVPMCTLSAARRARSAGGRMVEICVRSVRGLLVCRCSAVVVANVVSRLVRLGCCRCQHGRSPVALLRAAFGSGVGCPPTSWTPAAAAVSEGSVV